jgi:hypothetical protein
LVIDFKRVAINNRKATDARESNLQSMQKNIIINKMANELGF